MERVPPRPESETSAAMGCREGAPGLPSHAGTTPRTARTIASRSTSPVSHPSIVAALEPAMRSVEESLSPPMCPTPRLSGGGLAAREGGRGVEGLGSGGRDTVRSNPRLEGALSAAGSMTRFIAMAGGSTSRADVKRTSLCRHRLSDQAPAAHDEGEVYCAAELRRTRGLGLEHGGCGRDRSKSAACGRSPATVFEGTDLCFRGRRCGSLPRCRA